MEENIQIKTEDGKIIYGTLNACKSDKLLIFVHGLTGSQEEHHYLNAVPFFNENKFNTFRFDFYSRKPGSRTLSESSITSHSNDLKTVIDHFKDYEITLISHSVGGLVVLKTDLTGIAQSIFWDPTTPFKDLKDKRITYNAGLDKYILHWGMDIIVGKELIDEWMSLDLASLVKDVNIQCKFIFAGNYNKHILWKPFLGKHESVIIANASHGFIEEGTEKKLFEETLRMLK